LSWTKRKLGFSCHQEINDQELLVELKRRMQEVLSVAIHNAPVANNSTFKERINSLLNSYMEEKMENKNKYRLSRWCKWFKKGNIIAFLHNISLALIFLPESIGQKIISSDINYKKVDDYILEELRKERLIVDFDYDEMQELFQVRNKFLQNKSLEIAYLLLTDACNLKCKYCFEETPLLISKPVSAVNMNSITVKCAMNVFANLTKKYGRDGYKRIIHLYGGEPLINFKAAKEAIIEVEKLKRNQIMPEECEIAIVTNGVFLNEDVISFFAKHKVTVGISIDGPAHINNIYRVSKQENDVFPIILRNYKLLQKYSVKNGISATLTPDVINNFDEVLSFFIDKLKIQDGISFNILHYNQGILLDDTYFDKAAECLIYAFEKFRKLGIYEERMMRKARAFINRETMFSDCGAMGNQIVIAPDGLIGMCQDFVKPRMYFDYSVFDSNFDPYRSGLFRKWSRRSPLFMDQCLDCEALGICGGGCPANVELKTGNIWNIDNRICPHSKKSLEWLIWDTFSKSGFS